MPGRTRTTTPKTPAAAVTEAVPRANAAAKNAPAAKTASRKSAAAPATAKRSAAAAAKSEVPADAAVSPVKATRAKSATPAKAAAAPTPKTRAKADGAASAKASASKPAPATRTRSSAAAKDVAVVEPAAEEAPVVPFDLGKAIESMGTEHLQCRDFGHTWRPFTAHAQPDKKRYEQVLRCARCKTERFRYIGLQGQLLNSKYDYSEGYRIQGMGRLDTSGRDRIRLASMQLIVTD